MQLEEEQHIYNYKSKPQELRSRRSPEATGGSAEGRQWVPAGWKNQMVHRAKLLHAAYNKLTPHPPRNERDVHSEKHLNITMPTHADR